MAVEALAEMQDQAKGVLGSVKRMDVLISA
jgi:hypothetical protein